MLLAIQSQIDRSMDVSTFHAWALVGNLSIASLGMFIVGYIYFLLKQRVILFCFCFLWNCKQKTVYIAAISLNSLTRSCQIVACVDRLSAAITFLGGGGGGTDHSLSYAWVCLRKQAKSDSSVQDGPFNTKGWGRHYICVFFSQLTIFFFFLHFIITELL